MYSNEEFLLELLTEAGYVTAQDLQQVKASRKGQETPLETLIKTGIITDEQVAQLVASNSGMEYVDLNGYSASPVLKTLVPVEVSLKYKVAPIGMNGSTLQVVVSDPYDFETLDALPHVLQPDMEFFCSTPTLIKELQANVYGNEAVMGSAMTKLGAAGGASSDGDAPIIKLMTNILMEAFKNRASDIHIEPQKDGMCVRYRIDGVMMDGMKLPRKVMAALTSRFKIMSDMDIAEKRAPQDNRISATIGGRDFDFRVSSLPVVYGEKIVLRILDKGGINVGLHKLGFLPHNMKMLEDVCSRSYGIILVTGPTGSGKSTTLYSMLNNVNDGASNIITIEDPVEYELSGINQCGVNVRAGMTFAAGLRAMLRQDPDIIMIGEMRDTETATIAMEAALTGHLVLSTLHTNDAPSAPTRLIDMEVEPFLISSSIIGILAQRLVRTICTKCKEPYTASRESLIRYGFPVNDEVGVDTNGELTLFKGKGCENCKGTGYKGRTGVHEMMMMNDAIRDKILEKCPSHILRNLAVENGMKTLQMDAVQKILMGMTSVDEVLRVIYA
ncbi:MAG: GspE/PulE family protein [Prosthecobacter sp.]